MVGTIARALLIAVLVGAVALVASPSPSRADGHWPVTCGPYGPFGFDTYEAQNYVAEYGRAIDYAVQGAVPERYNISYPGLEKGTRDSNNTRPAPDPKYRIPPSIYKSIVWIESTWANAAASVPYGGVGQVLTSSDCGYGLGQVTTGMANTNGNAEADQAIVGTHFLFNIAEGVRLLADKWNSAPAYRPIAGLGDPAILEDWYYAIWSYNGFAFSNHPLNPERNEWRGEVYHCYSPDAPDDYFWWGYGDYTYPERVYGCMRYPPLRNNVPLYPAVTFEMPKYKEEGSPVAEAFKPSAFTSCQSIGFAGGCPAMDYPTPIKNADPTPTVSGAAPFIGNPSFAYSGSSEVYITASNSGAITGAGKVTVRNVGTYIAPFRIRTSAPWIVVHHPGEASRRLQGSVAVGSETTIVIQKDPLITKQGYQSDLIITVDPAKMPSSYSQGTVWLEPLLGSGQVFRISVTATKGAYNLPIRAVVPAISADKD